MILVSAFAYQSPAYWVFIIVGGGLAGQALWQSWRNTAIGSCH